MEYVVKQRDDTDDKFVEAIAQKIVYSYQACQIPEDTKQSMKASQNTQSTTLDFSELLSGVS